MSLIDQVWCNPSAVAVRLCAGLAGAKFALLPGRSATGRTTDGKYLFGSEVFFHNREDGNPNQCAGMVNLRQLRKSYARNGLKAPQASRSRSPVSAPEGLKSQAHSEQPQPRKRCCSIHTSFRLMATLVAAPHPNLTSMP